ncbi:MAG: cupin domain-containing protein [Actinomycetota bacterium]|nr:cupin domain-containing protein [Actinomycetota bacterium]
MVGEAKLVATANGLVPEGDGWFVVNARETRWIGSEELGKACTFEGDVRFPEVGINIGVLEPGQPACMYHGEEAQEDFLVLAGECLLLIEGEERRLTAWDFVHCPAWTEHVFVGAGSGPSVVLAVGARGRERGVRYPVANVARTYDASVHEETDNPREAYARFSDLVERPYREGDLPDW